MNILTLRKIWTYVKRYWWIPLGLIVVLILFIIGKNNSAWKILQIAKDSEKKQKEALDRINKETQGKKDTVKKVYEKAISEIETKYLSDKQEIKASTMEELKRLSEKYKNDPEGLAKEYAKEFGLKIDGLES